MEKCIDLNTSIHQLSKTYPEIIDILFSLGFTEIVKPMMLNTVGRFMTLNKGAKMRNIDIEMVIKTLEMHGFTVLKEENNE